MRDTHRRVSPCRLCYTADSGIEAPTHLYTQEETCASENVTLLLANPSDYILFLNILIKMSKHFPFTVIFFFQKFATYSLRP